MDELGETRHQTTPPHARRIGDHRGAAAATVLIGTHESASAGRLARLFGEAGLTPTLAFSCDQVVHEAHRDLYGLIALDSRFVCEQGSQCLQKIRAATPVPIMALGDVEDDVTSEIDVVLDPGNDGGDIARRANALIQMSRPAPLPIPLRWGPLELDVARHRALWRGNEVRLTILQFKIMEVLMLAGGSVVTDERLTHRVWRNGSGKDHDRLVSQIRRIRRLIEADPSNPQFLVRVRGTDFRLDDVADEGSTPP